MAGAVPGLLIKSGAEGVCAFALADGRAGAVKFDDGAQRAAPPLVAELLTRLIAAGDRAAALAGAAAAGAAAEAASMQPEGPTPAGADLAVLAELARPPVTGGGVPVGEIRAVLPPVHGSPPAFDPGSAPDLDTAIRKSRD